MTRDEFLAWRYYFLDLPSFSCGGRSSSLEKRMHKMCEKEIGFMKTGFASLCNYLKRPLNDSDLEIFARKAFWVKIVRESDAFTSLKMSKKRLSRYFKVVGIDNLASVADGRRPIVLLTGHYGSFFIPAIAFAHLGYKVYPIARTIDTSPATPAPSRYYIKLNYRFSEMRFSSRYIYTNFSGKIDREIVAIGKKGGIFWVAIDLPRRLYDYKRRAVTFFGMNGTLPAGIIPWALKRDAVFLTAWNGIEGIDEKRFNRRLVIDGPIPGDGVDSILQHYADRLSERVTAQPWQWLALQVIHQFFENEDATG